MGLQIAETRLSTCEGSTALKRDREEREEEFDKKGESVQSGERKTKPGVLLPDKRG